MLWPRMVTFAVGKAGNRDIEWEDGAATDPGDPRAGVPARVAVADGATEAYGSRRWAGELAEGFTSPPTAPRGLDGAALGRWFGERQAAWGRTVPAGATVLEELKMAEGSFATFLGCSLTGLDRPEPEWDAVALGDAVLFHERGGTLVNQLPSLGPADFGLDPHGAHTHPDALPQMARALLRQRAPLRPHDHLLLTTDALAHWIVRHQDRRGTWEFLTGVGHPEVFRRFVDDQRAAGELKNDDVTLVQVTLLDAPPTRLVVCR